MYDEYKFMNKRKVDLTIRKSFGKFLIIDGVFLFPL